MPARPAVADECGVCSRNERVPPPRTGWKLDPPGAFNDPTIMAHAYGPPLTQSEIDHRRRRLSAVLLIVGGSSFVLGVLLWRSVPSLDGSVRRFVLSNADIDSLAWKVFGLASGTRTCFVVVAVVGAWFAYTRRDWRPAVALLITLLLVQSGAEYLKGVFERSGPGGLAPESFPSGHAALAVLVWGYVAWFVPRALRRPFGAFVFVASMIVLIGSVASRVALDAHWFTDVLAGVGLGAAALVLAREATSVPLVRRVWVATAPRRSVSHRSQPG
jgi:membrane-associated phospholipid phosphatase